MTQIGTRQPDVFFPSLTQLRAFVEAARLDSISRASEGLRRSQSAVTQAIQNLEAELGATLFVRTSTGSYLTEVGRILRRRAEACFSRIDAALEELSEYNSKGNAPCATAARRITRAQILALTAVHEHGSFAQAARHVKVSLTSLHRSARSLEQQIGLKLFKNTAQGVATNKAGTKLANELHLAVRELEWAEEEIESQKGVLRGRLLIGSLMLAGNQFIATELDSFLAMHPEVKVSLVNGSYDELLPKIRGGGIDFLFGLLKNPPPADDVVEVSLGLDPYVIAVGKHHPLVGETKISLADLLAWEWIVPRPRAQRRSVFEALFANGPLPRYNIETHSLPTIVVLLAHSNRMTLLTSSELALDRRLGNQLTALNYVINAPPAAVGVTIRKEWEPTSLQRKFLGFLRSQSVERPGSPAEPLAAQNRHMGGLAAAPFF